MISPVAKHLTKSEITLFEIVKRTLHELPETKVELESDRIFVLTRAFSQVFPVYHEDGIYSPHYLHSWLRTESGHIIDLHQPDTYGDPILVINSIGSRAFWQYNKRSTRAISRGIFSMPPFRKAVRVTAKQISDIISESPRLK